MPLPFLSIQKRWARFLAVGSRLESELSIGSDRTWASLGCQDASVWGPTVQAGLRLLLSPDEGCYAALWFRNRRGAVRLRSCAGIVVTSIACAFTVVVGLAVDIPLVVVEEEGIPRVQSPVNSGVPLPK